jgi:hypothetical protein
LGTATTTAITTVPGTAATRVMADVALSPSSAMTDLSKEFVAATKYHDALWLEALRHPLAEGFGYGGRSRAPRVVLPTRVASA